MKVKFIGGVGTVTGSKTLVESGEVRILVDCGLFQGLKFLRELNWAELPIEPSTIDYVLLTHGHLDHCGWLPRLVAQGFQGKIYCSKPTYEIAKLILLDSAKIQEEEAKLANEKKFSKHEKAEPLYTIDQAKAVLPLFQIANEQEIILLNPQIKAVFNHVGHILGACSITLELEEKILVFSGDIGRSDDALMFPPTKPKEADYIFLESTYGNRIHPYSDVKLELETYINNAVNKNGTVIIPSFAVERAQILMFFIWQLKQEKRIPNIPYIIDTPMGIKALDIFSKNKEWHKLSIQDLESINKMFLLVSDYEESTSIIFDNQPKVIIAASGMVTGGRVLSYLEHYISVPETTIIMVGYQAEGTRGRKLLEGAREIKIRGKYHSVLASILEIKGLSAHGDQADLLDWLSELKNAPKKIFIVHGENQSADELRFKIQEKYGFDCSVATMGQEIEI